MWREGWQPETRRFAVEYIDGLQLDLVLMPAPWMPGLRDGEVALVDKDGALAMAATSYGLTSLASDLSTPWEMSARTRLAAALR